MTDVEGQPDLLAAATALLKANGFDVVNEPLAGAGAGWVLAESDLFVVAVAAAGDFDGLRHLESLAAPELLKRLNATTDLGAKRWDAYLVLMASRELDEAADATFAADMTYDTRGLRRLVAASVQPTDEGLRRVLRPFMPLPTPAPQGLPDPYQDLEEQLVVNGVGSEQAHLVVTAFRNQGHLEDV